MHSGQLKYYFLPMLKSGVGKDAEQKTTLKRIVRHYEKAGVILTSISKCSETSVSASSYDDSLGHFRMQGLLNHSEKRASCSTKFAIQRGFAKRVCSACPYARKGNASKGRSGLTQYIEIQSYWYWSVLQ